MKTPKVDFALVKRAQTGDQAAFSEIYNSTFAYVKAILLHRTMNSDNAEDLAQQTFILAFRKIKSFGFKASFSTWLYRIATNVYLMDRRKLTHKNRWMETVSIERVNKDMKESPGNRRDPFVVQDRELEFTPDRLILEQAISKLPKGYREMLILHELQGMQHNEVAAHLGCSVGNAKSQLFKAKRRMRKILKEISTCPGKGAARSAGLVRR